MATLGKFFARIRLVFVLAVASLALALPVQAQTKKSYTFGVVPQFEPQRLSAIWMPILQEIEVMTGIKLRMIGSPRIPEFEQHFQNGRFDFAYMNPYHSLVALDTQGYSPLVRDGGRELFGVLVVRKDSDVTSVADLEGKTIAFPAPNALGASLLMRAQLDREVGLDFNSSFVSTHTSSYLNVLLGETDAAGGVMGTFNRLDPEVRDQLRVVFTTRRLPPHPVTAHPRVPPEDVDAIRDAFLALANTTKGRMMLAEVPFRKLVPATIDDYASLRTLHLEDFYVPAGIR